MVNAKSVECEILDGPGKFDLMLAIFDGKEVVFTIPALRINARIYSVIAEDGSRESWNIAGAFKAAYDLGERGWKKFSGYYSTKKRTGILRYAA